MPSSDHLRAVIAIQRDVVAAGLDPDAVAQLVAERAHALTRAAGGSVQVVDGDELVSRGRAGSARERPACRLPLEGSLSGRVVREDRAMRCDDVSREDGVHPVAGQLGLSSIVAVPLRDGTRTFGVLKVYAREPGAFDERDAELLALLGEVAGAQLSNATDFVHAWRQGREDPVTGLLNRRVYDETLRRECARARRHDRDLALCLFDLDDFKAINDTRGHLAGDETLRRFADVLRGVRGEDHAFRLGGDEFGLVLPETDEAGARTVCLRLLEDSPVAASGGHAATRGGDPEMLHDAADRALYRHKRRHRAPQ